MTKDEEDQLLELLWKAYGIIENIDDPEHRDWLNEARELLDKVPRQ